MLVRWRLRTGQEIALYTGNDDNIVLDLLTQHVFEGWNCTLPAVCWAIGPSGHKRPSLLQQCKSIRARRTAQQTCNARIEVTDSNAAFSTQTTASLDALLASMKSCVARAEGIWCLEKERSYRRVSRQRLIAFTAYPHLNDDAFVEIP